MIGPLATIDWECFDVENLPCHLPSTDDYDQILNEVLSRGSAALTGSYGEPEGNSFYDTLELESDEDGDHTDDECYDEYECIEALDGGDNAAHEDNDYFDYT